MSMTDPETAGQRVRVLPLGGAIEVARSYLEVHVRHWWTGLCRGCGDRFPCRDRRDARMVLGGTDRLSEPTGRRVVLLTVPILAGIAVIAGIASGLVP